MSLLRTNSLNPVGAKLLTGLICTSNGYVEE
jgi:hypothetical protein